MLDGGRPLEAAQPRDPDGAGLADATEVVAQDVDDHHVLGTVLGAGQQLAARAPRSSARSRPRGPGALDRVRGDEPVRIDREERLRRGRQEGPRPAGLLARPEVEVGGEQRRIAGPQAAVRGPRVAVERRLEPAGQVGLVDVAARDVVADPLDAGLVLRARQRRSEAEALASAWVRIDGGAGGRVDVAAVDAAVRRTATPRLASRTRQPRVDLVEPAGQPPTVAVERPAAEPGVAGPSVPGDDPVVQRQAERRQALVLRRDGGQPLQHVTQVVPEEPDEPAEEPAARRPGRRASGPAGPGAGGRPRTGPARPPGASSTATGSAVR